MSGHAHYALFAEAARTLKDNRPVAETAAVARRACRASAAALARRAADLCASHVAGTGSRDQDLAPRFRELADELDGRREAASAALHRAAAAALTKKAA